MVGDDDAVDDAAAAKASECDCDEVGVRGYVAKEADAVENGWQEESL